MLKKLRELGFKTFGNFWDESYDEIEDKMERLEKVFEVIAYIDKQFDFKIQWRNVGKVCYLSLNTIMS